MSDLQQRHKGVPQFFIPLSGVVGLIVLIMPLYLYPIATFDPIQGGNFAQDPHYLNLYVSYAVLMAICALALLLRKMKKLFSIFLFAIFLVSHFHFKRVFGEAIVFKPAFVGAFIIGPAVIFLLGILASFSVSKKH